MTIDNTPDTSDEEDEDVSTKEDTTLSKRDDDDGFDSDASNEEHKSKTVRSLAHRVMSKTHFLPPSHSIPTYNRVSLEIKIVYCT